MKILIIGGACFIGAHLTRHLLKEGHDVVLLNRGKTKPLFGLDVETIKADRSELPALRDKIEQMSFDLVIDMMCMNKRDVNQLVDTFDGMIQRVSVISSADVYRVRDVVAKVDGSPIDNTPQREVAPLRQRLYPYNDAIEPDEDTDVIYDKIPVEKRLQEMQSSAWTICRLPAVYGPGDHRFYSYLRRFQDGRDKVLLDRTMAGWRFCWGYVEDVARGIAQASILLQGANQIFNLGEAQIPTWRERLEALAETLDWPLEIIETDDESSPVASFASKHNFKQHWMTDTHKARSMLGYQEHYRLRDGLKLMADWQLQNPPEKLNSKEYDYDTEDAYLTKIGL